MAVRCRTIGPKVSIDYSCTRISHVLWIVALLLLVHLSVRVHFTFISQLLINVITLMSIQVHFITEIMGRWGCCSGRGGAGGQGGRGYRFINMEK